MRETVFGKMISAEDLAKTINERDCFGIPMRVVKETIKYDLGETVSYHIEYVVKINGNDDAVLYRLTSSDTGSNPIEVCRGKRHEIWKELNDGD